MSRSPALTALLLSIGVCAEAPARAQLPVVREQVGVVATCVPADSVGVIVTAWQQGTNHVKVFGNYRDTFKPAACDFSLAENEGVLQPETARSYEGGVKIRTAEDRLDVEASGFRMDFENSSRPPSCQGCRVSRRAVSESELGDAQYYRMPARRLDVTFGLRF